MTSPRQSELAGVPDVRRRFRGSADGSTARTGEFTEGDIGGRKSAAMRSPCSEGLWLDSGLDERVRPDLVSTFAGVETVRKQRDRKRSVGGEELR